MGNGYNKWSHAGHAGAQGDVPFTRMLAGPMDFTPGGFNQHNEDQFMARDAMPFVMGTRARSWRSSWCTSASWPSCAIRRTGPGAPAGSSS